MIGLTPTQAETLAFIVAYRKGHGVSPTKREIRPGSVPGLNHVLAGLVNKGFIRLETDGRARNIVVLRESETDEPRAASPVMCLGCNDDTDASGWCIGCDRVSLYTRIAGVNVAIQIGTDGLDSRKRAVVVANVVSVLPRSLE
jgi:hypothetical protein